MVRSATGGRVRRRDSSNGDNGGKWHNARHRLQQAWGVLILDHSNYLIHLRKKTKFSKCTIKELAINEFWHWLSLFTFAVKLVWHTETDSESERFI